MKNKFGITVVITTVFLLTDRATAQDYCNPSPCGSNTDCSINSSGRPVCACKPTYIGNPLVACKHECEKNDDCSSDKSCLGFKCKDPCRNGCGNYAQCQVQNHKAICSCPEQYGGDGYVGCIPECTSQSQCPANLACIDLHCGNPCLERQPCQQNTDCKVDRHTAVCTCKRGFAGNPLKGGCYSFK